jgi:predicted PurR-regulated permease PerM
MSWAIIASANHFWIDMAMGGLIILVSWWIARRLERATDRRRERRAIEQLRGLESPPAG